MGDIFSPDVMLCYYHDVCFERADMNVRQNIENRENKCSHLMLARVRRALAGCDSRNPARYGPCFKRIVIVFCIARLSVVSNIKPRFSLPEGDHYRTRLTHTLEVSQIARTVARALALNEDLTEAIALGHDLRHTPFGHAGERVLNELAPSGFHHVIHSQRVVEFLENDGEGLNLSIEVVDGIRKHSKGRGLSIRSMRVFCRKHSKGVLFD